MPEESDPNQSAEPSSIEGKLTAITDNLSKISKRVNDVLRMQVATSEHLERVDVQLNAIDDTVNNIKSNNQQDDIAVSVDALETELSNMESRIMEELADMSQAINDRIDENHEIKMDFLRARFDNTDDELADLVNRPQGQIVNSFYGLNY